MLNPIKILTLAAAAFLLVVSTAGCSRSPEDRYRRALEAGKKYLEVQDNARAAVNFQNAIQLRPGEAEPHYLIATAFLNQVRLREAILSLRKATELKPDYPEAQLRLAELMIRTRNEQLTKDAEGRIQKLLTGHPGDNDSLFLLAAAQMQLGKREDAEKYLEDVLQKSPKHLRSAVALAMIKVSANELDAAEEILKKAVAMAPDSSEAAAALAMLYMHTGKTAEAERLFRSAAAINPKNAQALNGLALLQMKTGNLAGAEQTYKAISELGEKQHKLSYAVFLMQQKRQDAAVTELERLVKADPNDRIARSALVAGYLAVNRTVEAEKVLNKALEGNAQDIEALIQRSQVLLQQKKYDAAEQDCRTILRYDPASAQAHYLIAKVFKTRGDAAKQKYHLSEALRVAPESLRTRIELAHLLLKSKNAKAAIETLNEAQQVQKNSIAYVLAQNWALIANGEPARARNGVNAVMAVRNTPDALLQDAVLKVATQDYAGARASAEKILAAQPEDVPALALLAQTYVAQKQLPAATERIRQHMAQHGKSQAVRMFWATWLLDNGRKAEARDAFAAAKAADPGQSGADLFLARMDLTEGRRAEARQRLTAILEGNARNAEAHMLLAMIEESENHYAKAIEGYRKVLEIDRDDVVALNNLAYLSAQHAGQLDAALKYAQQAKSLAPENANIQDTLGWIYYRKGLYQGAVRELEQALARDPRPSIRFHLGLAYKQTGDVSKSRQLIAAAIAADPKLAESEYIP